MKGTKLKGIKSSDDRSNVAFWAWPLLIALFLGFGSACEPTGGDGYSAKDGYSLEQDSFPYLEMTVDELQKGYREGRFTVAEVVQAYLDRIDAIDREGPALNSVRAVNAQAMAVAEELDRELAAGESRGVLHGVPVLLKDNINTADMPTTAGSVFLEGSVPPADAFLVERLREAGAVILGKTNLSEWANFHSSFSSSGWSSLGGQVKNPYDLSRNPCGSSSGSGAAASANLAMLTIGTETNGSIVCPSNANGIVGLKPTVGLWSRSGIIPISYTTDSAGPMTRTVRDAAILLGALAVVDPADGMTMAEGHPAAAGNSGAAGHSGVVVDYTQFLQEDGLAGKRLGFYTAPRGNHFRVDERMEQAIAVMEAAGAEIIEIPRISTENVGGDAFTVLMYEFREGLDAYFSSLGDGGAVSSVEDLSERIRQNTSRYGGLVDYDLIHQAAELWSDEQSRLEAEAAYEKALERMLRVSRDEGIDRIVEEHNLDALFSYTGSPAWKTDLTLGDNFQLASSSPSARAGYPIISVPMGELDGLPLGISFFGRAWSEPVLLEIAYDFEQKTKHRFAPSFFE